MVKIRICDDLDEAGQIWEKLWPKHQIFDLWEVRQCFQNVLHHKPHFLISEENGKISGALALSWIEDTDGYGHFPGETWQGKTWLEQNRILARDAKQLRYLIHNIPGNTNIRYLTQDAVLFGDTPCETDEVGYLFYPKQYNYSFDNYFSGFSAKSRKKLNRELRSFEKRGVSYRYGHLYDIDLMFKMNGESFGELSFFSHPGFYKSFKNLLFWLESNQMLRLTTVIVDGEVAAIDVGALFNGVYTVLAGGVNKDFPGIAKLINFHHLNWACRQHFKAVDFLCGNYGWKERFHLTPRPLYKMVIPAARRVAHPSAFTPYAAYATA